MEDQPKNMQDSNMQDSMHSDNNSQETTTNAVEETRVEQPETVADESHADAQNGAEETSAQTETEANEEDNVLSVDKLNEQLEAMKAQVLRERADNDNLRKRQQRELQNAYKFATEKLIKDLLPVIDSLALGIESAQKSEQADSLTQFVSGSEMTLKLLTDTLERHGVVEINPEGEKFDPERHEAISMAPNPDMEPNTVMHVTQKGYELNGRVIRAAQVVVCQAPST